MASAKHESGTILRIKRKRDDDPFNALFVHSTCAKKSKFEIPTDNDNNLFRFAGTVKENEVSSTVTLLENFHETNHKREIIKLKRNRKTKQEKQEAHYRIVSQVRNDRDISADIENSSTTNNDDSKYNVYDVVADPVDDPMQTSTNIDRLMCNSVQMIREKLCIDGESVAKIEPEYVYDIYYAPGAILNADNDILRIEEFYDDVIFDHGVMSDDEDQYDDDDDSNAEDNWRNDYPDEDEYYSSADEVDRDDIGEMIGGENSSDDGSFDHGYKMYRTGAGRENFDPYASKYEGYYGTVADGESDDDDDT